MTNNNKKREIDRSRRAFMLKGAATVPAVTLAGVVLAKADEKSIQNRGDNAVLLSEYKPLFFNEEEWRFILAACDRLIPSDELSGGALEAHVPIYIDWQMMDRYGEGGYWYMQGPFYPDKPAEMGYQLRFTPKELYRLGIANLNRYLAGKYDQRFDQLDESVQIEVLKGLESGEIKLENVPGHTFFEYLLKNSKEGFFADPQYGGNYNLIGWKLIGFPGARADYRDWIGKQNQQYPFPAVAISGQRGI